jgi:hypothetical protein
MPEEQVYAVTAGPLYDRHKNIVANGTVVVFEYRNRQMIHHMEAALLNGIAEVKIPAKGGISYSLVARVNETSSTNIQLRP